MPRMIDLIRESAVPASLMRTAAKGALAVPPEEMIEILVYLSTQHKVVSEQARMTLAGWDEASARAVAANPTAPKEVLEYFIDPHNLRPVLLAVLIENPALNEESIITLAASATREQATVLLNSPRVSRSQEILSVIAANANLGEAESRKIQEKLSLLEADNVSEPARQEATLPPEVAAESGFNSNLAPVVGDESAVSEEALTAYLSEHAAEIAAALGKSFQPIGGIYEELPAEASEAPAQSASAAVATASDSGQGAATAATAVRHAVEKKTFLTTEEQRGSALQKIAKLDVKGRIQLAVKGNKEERSILIRDGTKIVALAVLESPKLTDGEVEKFASQKNVLEAVLRAIPMKRRFVKMHPVVRNLTFNPRTPIDVSLGLMKYLLVQDLRHLSGNKEVSDTVRKLALKMFRQKLDVSKKS